MEEYNLETEVLVSCLLLLKIIDLIMSKTRTQRLRRTADRNKSSKWKEIIYYRMAQNHSIKCKS